MRISECQARTLAEAKELNLSVPLNDGTKLNVTELGNPSENDSDDEDNSNAGASYRGKINDYPNDLSKGEIASVNGNIIIGNGNEVIKCLRFGKSYPISNIYDKGKYVNDTNFIKNISYPSTNVDNNLVIDINTVPIVLSDIPVTINNYDNATSNDNLTIITYVKINGIDGVICDSTTELGYMLYSDNFAEMFSDMFDDITELELFYFDKSIESVIVTNSNNNNAIKSFLNTFYNRGDVITCIPPARDFIVDSNKSYDEFKINDSFKFTNNNNNNNQGDVIIRNKNLIITKDNINDNFYAKVNLITGEIIDDSIITADFIKDKNNWDISIRPGIVDIELFKTYNEVLNYLEANNIEDNILYNDELLGNLSDRNVPDEDGRYLYLIVLLSLGENIVAVGGFYFDEYYDTSLGYCRGFMFGSTIGILYIDDEGFLSFNYKYNEPSFVIANCKTKLNNIVIPYEDYINYTLTASKGSSYSSSFHPIIYNNNIKLKRFNAYECCVLNDSNLSYYDRLNKVFPIYNIIDIELGNITAIDGIRACALEGQTDIVDYLFNECLNKFYYVEVTIKNVIYKLPIIMRYFNNNDSKLDNYNNYDDTNDDMWNHIFTNMCAIIEVGEDYIIPPLIKYDEVRVSKYNTNSSEDDTFNHFESNIPISYVVRNLVYPGYYSSTGESNGSIELYKITDLNFTDDLSNTNNEIIISY